MLKKEEEEGNSSLLLLDKHHAAKTHLYIRCQLNNKTLMGTNYLVGCKNTFQNISAQKFGAFATSTAFSSSQPTALVCSASQTRSWCHVHDQALRCTRNGKQATLYCKRWSSAVHTCLEEHAPPPQRHAGCCMKLIRSAQPPSPDHQDKMRQRFRG